MSFPEPPALTAPDTRPIRTPRSTTPRRRNNGTRGLQSWTASRCLRKLRQLESRIVALRRLVSEEDPPPTPTGATKRTNPRGQDGQRKRARFTYGSRRPKHTGTDELPMTPPRSTRRLGAMMVDKRTSQHPSQNSFPTPIYSRSRDIPVCPEEATQSPQSKGSRAIPRQLSEALQCFRSSDPDGRYRIYRGIFDWLSDLLVSTAVTEKEPPRKSLIGMCLRKVPACVDEIEAWDQQMGLDGPEDFIPQASDVASAIYGQLEEFGSPTLGWQPMKQTLRAHGISILAKGIAEGLFEPSYVGLLVRICVHHGAMDEAAGFVLANPGALPPPRSPKSVFGESTQLQPLRALLANAIQDMGGSRGTALGCVSALLRDRRLPMAWIWAKAFSTVLPASFEEVTGGRCGPVAVEFLTTTTKILCSSNGKSTGWDTADKQKTLVRLVAGLATAALEVGLQKSGADTGDSERKTRLLLHAMNACTRSVRTSHKSSEAFILSLGQLLVAKRGNTGPDGDDYRKQKSANDASELWGGHMNGMKDDDAAETRYGQTLQLVCSMAQGESYVRGCAGHNSLLRICNMMQDLPLPARFLDELMADGVFLLAQKTKDPRDVAFVERHMHGAAPDGRNGVAAAAAAAAGRRSMLAGWRWEDGIGEWVMGSPDIKDKTKNSRTASFQKRSATWAMGGRPAHQTRRPTNQALSSDTELPGSDNENRDMDLGRDKDDGGYEDANESNTCQETGSSMGGDGRTDENTIGKVVAQACGEKGSWARAKPAVESEGENENNGGDTDEDTSEMEEGAWHRNPGRGPRGGESIINSTSIRWGGSGSGSGGGKGPLLSPYEHGHESSWWGETGAARLGRRRRQLLIVQQHASGGLRRL